MPTPTVPVTVTLAAQDGTPYVGVTVRARLDRNDVYEDGADGSVVIADQIEAVTDADGVAILDCFPNAIAPDGLGTLGTVYTFRANIPGGRHLNVQALVPNAACRLEDIITNVSAAEQEVLAAAASAAAAAASAAEAASVVTVLGLATYASLRAYAGAETRAYITGYLVTAAPAGIAGMFVVDPSDTTSADNGGTIIVGADNRRWKRAYDGPMQTQWFAPDNTGATVATTAIQNAIDAAGLTSAEYSAVGDDYRRAKRKLYVNDGTYLIADLKMYQGSCIEFGPKAVFKLNTGAKYGIKTVNRIGQTHANFGVEKPVLVRPRIDMDSKGVFGILYECAQMGEIIEPEVLNVPTGTGTYDDPFVTGGSYACMGIAVKGIDGVQGAYWNTIRKPRVPAGGSAGNIGVGFLTSAGGTNQRANHNKVEGGFLRNLARGVSILAGGDNLIEMVDASTCSIGFAVGQTTGTVPCQRNRLVMSYIEGCTTSGIRITSNGEDTVIDGLASTSGTATPVDDSGVNTTFFPGNTNTFTSYARFYKGAVRFPAVRQADASANAIDFFEEGDFTLVVIGTGTAGTGTYTIQAGNYQRINDRCRGHANLTWTAHTGVGNMRLSGLPFTSRSGGHAPPVVVNAADITLTANNTMRAAISPNSVEIALSQVPTGGGASANVTLDTAGTVNVTFDYQTAS